MKTPEGDSRTKHTIYKHSKLGPKQTGVPTGEQWL